MFIYSALFFLFLLALRGLVFILVHLPAASALDRFIIAVVSIERMLTAPKRFLRLLWPSQSTPAYLNLSLTILNGLLWGTFLAAFKSCLRNRGRNLNGQ